jgi:uncharacterized protein (DUF1778 family)
MDKPVKQRRFGTTSEPQVAVRFDDEDRRFLDGAAKLERLSRSDIIRRAVRAYAKSLGINPQAPQA